MLDDKTPPAMNSVPGSDAPGRAATLDPRTRALLETPILRVLMRLTLPNMLVMLAQASTGVVETYFIGKLGTPSLAGVSLVFPGVMLMQTMSAGAFGGAISSAIARALGGGRPAEANALVIHGVVISAIAGLLFSIIALVGGPPLYRAMGGKGEALSAALTYSNIVFAGVILLWLFNALASVVRATGNMRVPAAITCGGALVLPLVSPCLIFGLGPLPRLGVAGGGIALMLYYLIGSSIFVAYLLSGRSVLRPSISGVFLRWALFQKILRVGVVGALVSLMTNVTVVLTTSMIGTFGAASIAGYGVGSRLEYLMIPLAFSFGAPLVVLVGTHIGAGQRERALRIAWLGAIIAFSLTEAVGLVVALWPDLWLTIFDRSPQMLASGSAYLRIVGPFYGLFGLGTTLFFASQGAGRVAWPLLAAVLRMLVAVIGGFALLRWTGRIDGVFYALAAGLVIYGSMNTAAVWAGVWFRPASSLFGALRKSASFHSTPPLATQKEKTS
jgi:putative MATE family efflux protein